MRWAAGGCAKSAEPFLQSPFCKILSFGAFALLGIIIIFLVVLCSAAFLGPGWIPRGKKSFCLMGYWKGRERGVCGHLKSSSFFCRIGWSCRIGWDNMRMWYEDIEIIWGWSSFDLKGRQQPAQINGVMLWFFFSFFFSYFCFLTFLSLCTTTAFEWRRAWKCFWENAQPSFTKFIETEIIKQHMAEISKTWKEDISNVVINLGTQETDF